ncbi:MULTISPECIES: glycosyltransferase family 1 protein [unclassified Beijerinckia]|uniref:glycosyltransferase family 4 protein n=1 Tax=unclassified Beijerinckia TaxID=2638183 RepID=UPI0008998045|nr:MULTISPECIES: glycosyltransferase family 1 protein [unclassified Beijerinckia]MDH7794332.1 glycosyltransferase involved in cell wall biosynthesis [Beijerinckia sp. GAS462]SEB59122.1 Glycosyltransferase involved in cell wall bisynthesis [Beijerinckia sp. 28-YEA-48]
MKISLMVPLRAVRRQIVHQALRLSGEGVERGDKRYQAGDWRRAYRAYRTHLVDRPQDGKVWAKAADCARRAGDFSGEFYSLRQALLLEPNDVAILVDAARQYKDRGYLLTARACLASARRVDPMLPFEAFERAVAPLSVESGHRLLLDVTDMFAFFRLNVRKTGMQRVQAQVMTSLLERHVGGDIIFTFYNELLREYKIASTLLACELVDASNADEVTVEQLAVILNQIFIDAEPLKCRKGDFYLVLGAFWFGNDYLARLEDLRKDGATVGINFFDLIPYTHPEYVDVATQRDFTGKLEEALASIDYACTNSAFVADELRRLLASLGRENVPVGPVPLAHDITASDSEQVVSDTFKQSVPKDYVLCVGTIERRKNHALLLEIWKRLYAQHGDKTPSLVIVGKWGWRIEEFREELAASKNVHGKIMIREGLADSELEYLYRNCLFTVFPSFTEGWGLPVGESLYFGKPCIASNSSSIPEVGGDLVRYFDPMNTNEAYRVIDAALSDRSDLAVWTEQVRNHFKPRSWDQVTDDLMQQIFKLSAIAKSLPMV